LLYCTWCGPQLDHVNGELQIRSTLSGTGEKNWRFSGALCECVCFKCTHCAGTTIAAPLPRVSGLSPEGTTAAKLPAIRGSSPGRAHLRFGHCRHKLKWEKI
jgi:hypothetical protein